MSDMKKVINEKVMLPKWFAYSVCILAGLGVNRILEVIGILN